MARGQWQILMVDNDADYTASVRPFLEERLGRVFPAESETQAESILSGEAIDLVLLEVMLAEPDGGLRWCRRIRKDRRFAKLPVFLLSCADELYGLKLKNKLAEPGYCPAQGFLDKSTQAVQIADRLEKFLRSQG